MKTREIIFSGIGRVEVVERDFLEPETLWRDDLLLRTEYTLISPGTELDCLNGRDLGGNHFPKCLGYSAVCRVMKCGAEAKKFQPGMRVLVYHSTHRAFQVKNKEDVVPVPEGLDPVEALFAVIGCMGFQGVRKVRLELGEAVMIMGLGLLGQIALQTAARSGAFPLIALDFNPCRRAIALEQGADYAFSPDEPDLSDKVKTLTREGQGVNAVIEVTGAPGAVKQALQMTAPLGRVALVGCSRTPTQEIDFYNAVHRPGIQLIGAHNFVRPKQDSYPGYWTMREDMALLMELIKAGRINTRCLISEVVPPERAPEMYARLQAREPALLGVVFDWQS